MYPTQLLCSRFCCGQLKPCQAHTTQKLYPLHRHALQRAFVHTVQQTRSQGQQSKKYGFCQPLLRNTVQHKHHSQILRLVSVLQAQCSFRVEDSKLSGSSYCCLLSFPAHKTDLLLSYSSCVVCISAGTHVCRSTWPRCVVCAELRHTQTTVHRV